MSLRDSIQDTSLELGQLENSAVQAAAVDQHAGLLKSQLHSRLLERLDLGAIENMPPQALRAHLKTCIEQIIAEDRLLINETDLGRLIQDIQNEIVGLGPLEPLLDR